MLIHHVTFSFFLCAWFGICLVDYGAILLRRTKRRIQIQTTKVTRLEEGEKNQELMTWTDFGTFTWLPLVIDSDCFPELAPRPLLYQVSFHSWQ